MQIRILTDLITKKDGFRKGYCYEVDKALALEFLKHGFCELVATEQKRETAVTKPLTKNKRGK